jgi:hypothetical protein
VSGSVIGVVKTHLIETAPNHGPTLGGESFAVTGPTVATFLAGDAAGRSENGASLPAAEIAARAVASTVMIICQKDEAK